MFVEDIVNVLTILGKDVSDLYHFSQAVPFS